MIIMLKKSTRVIISTIFVFILFTSITVEAVGFNDNQTVGKNKDWTIKFNQEILFDEFTKQGIKVVDSKGNYVENFLVLGQDKKTIIVEAPVGGYIEGENYTLIIDSSIKSRSGKSLKETVKFKFNIEKKDSDFVINFKDKNFEDAIRIETNKPTSKLRGATLPLAKVPGTARLLSKLAIM